MSDLLALADRVEKEAAGSRELDGEICLALGWTYQKMKGDSRAYYRRPGVTEYYQRDEPPAFTSSLDDTRKSFPYLCVFASDMGADGLAMVKLVADTSTTPVIEYAGIAARLEAAWLAAALRALANTGSAT